MSKAFANKKFSDTLKLPDITPAYKKLDVTAKANYRPVSIFFIFLHQKSLKKLCMTNFIHTYIEDFSQ